MSFLTVLGDRVAGRAPEFKAKAWLNVPSPLTMAGLSGKVVVLDFWTYCCINCMHVLPDLARLEEKYAGKAFAVVGVHSAKFTNEALVDNIRQAVLRYEVRHPVAVDDDFGTWNAFGVDSWPTIIVVAPDGRIAGRFSGEGNYEEIDGLVAGLLKQFAGKLKPAPIPLKQEEAPEGLLSFPGKCAYDSGAGLIAVSDSNHNRILLLDESGMILDTAGCGKAGLVDGQFGSACFSRPQGLCFSAGKLYVADTENHAVRVVDPAARTVHTIAGDGTQGGNRPDSVAVTRLSSPWDLAVAGKTLYVAMAGNHQIWKIRLLSGLVEPYAGTGMEAVRDGPANDACFAQPSGLALIGSSLFVADSEASTIRWIDLEGNDTVHTIAGSGKLFGFGDLDETGHRARFQHPLGLAAYGEDVLVADTYNHKVKLLEPHTGKVTTFFSEGLAEPAGCCSLGAGRVLVCDTNNHRLLVVKAGSATQLAVRRKEQEKIKKIRDPVKIRIAFSKGRKATSGSPHYAQWEDGSSIKFQRNSVNVPRGRPVVLTINYCKKNLCLFKKIELTPKGPVTVLV